MASFEKYKSNIIIIFLIFLVLFAGVIIISYLLKENQVQADEKKRQALYDQILDGASTAPVDITVDYTSQIAKGSPLIFGGAQTPPLEHEDAWSQIRDAGVTSVRKDLYVEFSLPRDIKIEDYKNNVNDIRNPNNWDKKTIPTLKATLRKVKQEGMISIGIMGYSPRWLTYNNTPFGVPKDWDVFKDIVKKIYAIYRDDLDYIEIWNEPDHKIFLVTEGSNLSKEEAYNKIYYYASQAIREVDKEKNDGKVIPIGGPVESNPRVSDLLQSLINDPKIIEKPDFFSFHTYDEFKESLEKYRNIANSNSQTQNKPIFITEWNMDSNFFDDAPYKTGDVSILFTANRFIDYLKESIYGANYFALLPINTNNRGTDEKTMGFYRWENGRAELLSQARTWRILSNKLGLGKGPSTIYKVDQKVDDFNSIGFINAQGQRGVAIVNNGDGQIAALHFKNTGIGQYGKITIYYASSDNEAKTPVYEGHIKTDKGAMDLHFYLPKETIIGLTFNEEQEWFNILRFLN